MKAYLVRVDPVHNTSSIRARDHSRWTHQDAQDVQRAHAEENEGHPIRVRRRVGRRKFPEIGQKVLNVALC